MKESKKSRNIVLKGFVTATLIFYLIYQIDFEEALNILRKSNPIYILLSFFLINLGIFISSYKWYLLLRGKGIEYSYLRLNTAYYIGSFFNNFLPSIIGGDFIKSKLISKKEDFHLIMSSTIVERYLGVLATLVFVFVSYFIVLSRVNFPIEAMIIAILISFAAIAFPIILIYGSRLSNVKKLIQYLPKNTYKVLEKYFIALKEFKKNILIGFCLSIVFHLVRLLIYYTVCMFLSVEVDIFFLAFAMSVNTIILMFPISINGIGVRESVFVVILGQIGVNPTKSALVGFSVYTLVLISSLVGGILYTTFDKKLKINT